MTNIGGFFASLGIKIDANSFDKSKNALESVSNGFSRMLGVVRNASAVMLDLTESMGEMGSAEIKVANYLGISTHALSDWRNTAKLASIDSNALVNDISNLETKLSRINQGIVPNDMVKALGLLGVNQDIISFSNMGMAERVQVVFDAAASNGNQTNAADLVGQILGSGFKDLYLSGIVQREGFAAVFEKAQKLNYTSDKTALQADLFNTEKNAFTTAVENMGKFLGAEIAGEMTPILKEINKWLGTNGNEIKKVLTGIASGIGEITKNLFQGTKETIDNTKAAIEAFNSGDAKAGVDYLSKAGEAQGLTAGAIVTGRTYEEQKDLYNKSWDITVMINRERERLGLNNVFDRWKKLPWEKTSQAFKDAFISAGGTIEKYAHNIDFGNVKKINDGIIKPNGGVIEIAPDDWVFAARNLSDMAGAFIPHSFNSQTAKNDIVINQTINVTGNNDTHTIRQQARLGLTDALQQATRYAQMMPQLN